MEKNKDEEKKRKRKEYQSKFKQPSIRYTLDEFKIITKKAALINLDITNYIKESSLQDKLINTKKHNEDYQLILKELKKIGTNINQITMKINATKNLTKEEKERLFTLLEDLKKMIFKDILFKK